MARYTGPVCRLCRREGTKLFLKGDRCTSGKCALDRRNTAPGQHGAANKKMKEYADISPMEYVMKVKLHRAVELLKDDSLSVQDVAMAVGFNTHSFFSECFKREFGMTPRQWRHKNVIKSTITK